MDNIMEIFLQRGFWQTEQMTSAREGQCQPTPISQHKPKLPNFR